MLCPSVRAQLNPQHQMFAAPVVIVAFSIFTVNSQWRPRFLYGIYHHTNMAHLLPVLQTTSEYNHHDHGSWPEAMYQLHRNVHDGRQCREAAEVGRTRLFIFATWRKLFESFVFLRCPQCYECPVFGQTLALKDI